jgi:hypothetical protein
MNNILDILLGYLKKDQVDLVNSLRRMREIDLEF